MFHLKIVISSSSRILEIKENYSRTGAFYYNMYIDHDFVSI